MTTSNRTPDSRRSEVPLFSVAGAFLEGLAAQDFSRIADTLGDDAQLTALVPSGFKQWHGPEQIGATFRRWFGDVDEFELVDALRRRGRLRGCTCAGAPACRARASASAGSWWSSRCTPTRAPMAGSRELFLLCSGFCREPLP